MISWYLASFPRLFGQIEGIPYNLFNTLRALPYFFIGVIFGLHYKSFKVPNYLKSSWFILALCLIPLMYPEFTPINEGDKKRMWLSYEILFVMSTVFFCVVFLVPNNTIFLANKVGDFIGKVSYSLYLLHMPIIVMVNKLNLGTELKLVLSLSLSILIAYVSYRFFERPVASTLRGFANSRSQERLEGV